MKSALPLSDLRILDLSQGIPGAYATKLFVDAGADVLKVEPPGGDPLRRWTACGAPLRPGEDGALFQFLNACKRSMAVDPNNAADCDLVRQLACEADILFDSGVPGMLDRLDMTVGDLMAANPRLCVVTITPWGRTGPWRERPATEFTLQAQAGSTGARGLRDRKPVAAGGRLGEWVAGCFAAVGAFSAWLAARAGGRGQEVDVSIFEAVLLAMTIYWDLEGQWVAGPLRRSVEIPSVEPARDGWVGFTTITGQQWLDFCAMIGRADLAADPRLRFGIQRMDHYDMLKEAIHAWTRQHGVAEILELADALRVPAAPVGNGANVVEMDHFRERGVFVANPAGFLQPRRPYGFQGLETRDLRPAPGLDEHGPQVRAGEWWSAGGKRGQGALAEAPELPLTGLRVIDLTAFWAGPLATCYLAAMGADVIKVESVQRPDGMRLAGATVPNADPLWEWSPVFAGANPGKRDLTLRLDSAEGRELLLRLVAAADVVIENFSVRVLENLDLDWPALAEVNPRVILVRMPAYGLTGPWRDRPGFAMTIEQVCGLAWITGYRDLPLVPRGVCDPVGAMHTVFALLSALEARRATDAGMVVEVPLVECALNIAAEAIVEYGAYGRVLERDENRGPAAAPQGVYRCAGEDAFVAVAVCDEAQWAALTRLLDASNWAEDPELEDARGRRRRHDEIDAGIEAWTRKRAPEEAAALLLAEGIPAAPVIDPRRVWPNPQLQHRRFFQVMDHPVTGRTRYPGFPMRFSAFGDGLHRTPPPLLGQHNAQILRRELGLSDDRVRELRERQIIGERPTFL